MARNARIHGVLIYLWIHSKQLFDFYLNQFRLMQKNINRLSIFLLIPVFILIKNIIYISRIQRFFANISTTFNRDMERDTVSVIMI